MPFTYYINTQTLQYPIFEGDIRLVYESLNRPIGEVFQLPDDGLFEKVEVLPIPTEVDNFYHRILPNRPVKKDGVWTQSHFIYHLTDDEIREREAMRAVARRSIRSIDNSNQDETSGSPPNVID
jgi:hypothetical protein